MEVNKEAPHKTVIFIKSITYEILPTGECSGNPIRVLDQILQVEGKDQNDCLEKTDLVLKEFKNVTVGNDTSRR
jgi:hypothetical protein